MQRLTLLKKNHLDEQYVARRSVRDLPGTIAGISERLTKLSTDEATAKTHAADPIAIGGRTYPREDIPEILGGKLDSLPKSVRETTRIPLGTYRGLRFGIVLNSQFPPDVYLEGSMTRQTSLSKEHQGPRAVLNALERLANAYGSECDRVRQDLAIAEAQLRDYDARLGKPFTLDSYLLELTGLRDQLKAGLSAGGHEPGKEEGPSVSELAEKIKTLKAAHRIDATPQRVRQKHSTAEEPITTRIRRRARSGQQLNTAAPLGVGDTENTTMPMDCDESAVNSHGRNALPIESYTSNESPDEPRISFRERLLLERRRKGQKPSVS